ncbi:Transcriptional regulator of nonfermentable carbon utilization [Savitreella phatthalungensis]
MPTGRAAGSDTTQSPMERQQPSVQQSDDRLTIPQHADSHPHTNSTSAASAQSQVLNPAAIKNEGPNVGDIGEAKPRQKRKKASRACLHCQKAHLTCDDARPCGRCIKRGLHTTCHDGVRKRAKYLQDVDLDDLYLAPGANRSSPQVVTPTTATAYSGIPPSPGMVSAYSQMPSLQRNGSSYSNPAELAAQGTESTFHDNASTQSNVNMATVSVDASASALFGDHFLFDYPPLSSYDFDSKAANLEYSMISTMLGRAMTPGTEASSDPFALSPQSLRPGDLAMSRQSQAHPWLGSGASSGMPAPAPLSTMPLTTAEQIGKQDIPSPATSNQSFSSQPKSQPAAPSNHIDPHGQRPTPVARRAVPGASKDPSSIYTAITRPFSYTNGYHLLNSYLRSRFDKEDLVRIARAIVGYRPSFIALTKTLREEDLTFMEVCFQRTLLEYEKFVGYSGTPTVIWRRTGQIELVGKEFCLLTGWTRDQLLGKQTFIVELMDDASVVEYFEQFSQHAFGDTSSVVTTCILLTPPVKRRDKADEEQGATACGEEKTPAQGKVPCAFCFTIKRDVFDIPMMIVGNFLPCLS